MYIYDGFKYSEEEIKNAADKAGLSIEDYTSKNEITFEDEAQDFPTSTVEDADAVQQPMTASQAGFTELPSVDIPSESQDPKQAEDVPLVPADPSLELQPSFPFSVNGYQVTEKEFKQYEQDLANQDVLEESESFYSIPGYIDFFSDMWRSAKEGWKQSEVVDPAFELFLSGADSSDKEVLDFVNKNKEIARKNLGSAEMKEFDKVYEEEGGGFWGFIKGAYKNPSVLPSMLISSVASQAGSIFNSGEVRAAAATGAATGSLLGPVGVAPGIMTGSMAAMETGLTFSELLQEEAGGLDSAEIKKILQNPERLADLKNKALKRGLTIAAVELATLGVAKGVGGKIAKAGFRGAPVTAATATGAIEMIGGSTGEVAGRFVAGQEMNAKDIISEGVVGKAGAPLSMAGQLRNLKTNIDRVKIKKQVKNSDYSNIVDVFNPETKTDAIEINLSKIKNSEKILNEELSKKINNGEITSKQAGEIKQNAAETQGILNRIEPLNLTEGNEVKVVELQKEKSKLNSEIKRVNDKALTAPQIERVKAIDEELTSTVIRNTTEKVMKVAEDIKSVNIEVAKNQEQADQIAKDKNLSKKVIAEDGYILQDSDTGKQTIVINEEAAKKGKSVNVAAHEFLHAVLFQTVKDSPETQIALGESLNEYINKIDANQIKDSDFANRLKLYKDSDKATQSEEVLTLFSDAIATGDIQFNENVFTKIGDVIRRALQNIGVNVKFNNGKDVYNFVKDYNKSIEKGKLTKAQKAITEKQAKGKLVKEKIDSEVKTDIKASKSLELQEQLDNLDEFDFDNEVDFQTAKTNLETKIRLAKKKELSKPTEEAKPKDKTKDDTKKNEKRIGDQLKAMVPPGTTNKDFKEKVAIKVIDNIDNGMLNPLIKKIAAGYGVVADNVYGKSWDDFFIEVAGVQLKKNIMSFNPESNDDLGGYIIGSQYGVRNRVKEALAKFKKEGESGFKEDVSVAKNVIAKEDAAPQEAEKRKYTPLTKSNVVPNFTITAITDKLTKVLSSLESKITDKRGDNSATTPLIAEIKKKIGKVVGDPEAAPKIVIQRLGKLKDGTYEKNLIKNKKAIIENMTTTFLMGKDSGKKVSGGIPQAIEKSVGGKFTGKKVTVNVGGKEIVQEEFAPNFVPYPEWVGQKIDREKTLVRGATAGNEIVRRVPADKVSDADFVGLFIDEKGKLIRGKREALGKALAEEMAFEILSKEIKNENSEISKAFEGNQEAQGEVLSDNFVNELTRDIDRGTVKFSLSTGDAKLDKARTNLGKYITSKYKFPNGLSNEQFYALVKRDAPLKELFDTLKKEYKRYLGRIKTDRMTELAVKFNASGNDNFNVFLNNYFDNKFSNISSALGVDPNSISRFKIKEETARKTKSFLQDYILDLINKDPKNAAKTFITTLQSALASGTKQSLFGTNENLYKFIKSIKDDKVEKAFKNVKLVKSASGLTFQIGKEKVTTKFKQETSASDFNSLINDYINNVEVDKRNEYADKAANAFLNFIDYLKDNKIDPEITGLLLNSLGGSMRSSAKTLAKIKGAFIVEGLTAKDYTFEHGIPTNQLLVASALYIYNKNNNINKSFIKNIIDKSSIYIIPTKISDAIDSFYRNTFSNDKALSDTNPEFYRYFSKNKYFQNYLKDKGISQFEESNITNLLDPKAAVKRNIKFSKSLAAFDPKGKVYKPSDKFSKTMNSTFNKMLERKTGIAADETISKTIANRRGQKKGKYKIFMPSSLDDFKGLTSYTFAGKGKQGEADQKFFQDTLIDPYFKGIRAIEETRQAFKEDFRALNKQMKPVIKKLGKLVPGTEFTHDQAIRVALWNASGYEIPGISEVEQKKLVDYVNDNADLSEYARKLQQIAKRPKWAKPGDFWDAETILSDLNNLTEKVGRKEFLSEFIENAGIIFSEENLNKVQAGYGKATRDALEDILYRMENGTNRPSSTTDNTNRWNTWINNSIGAIMFFNRRSALLQTLSTVNFINWSDNNPLKAAAAFANQKQYWSDFATLFNSSKLKQRRAGLKSDVNEAEIARAVKGSKNKATAALSYLLKIGFTPTQMADSFAIAAGGATFYRNRIKSYLKKVNEDGEALYTKEQAEEMAFKDFSQISEETQQSGDPALISSDQASTAGRLLLAFQNTPIQLNRSIKKAALDIKNRRRIPGQTLAQSNFSNFSKIIYYGTIQNVIFSALQNALFALIPGFEEEDDELTEEEQLEKYGKVYSTKQSRIINGMVDTTLKGGFGLPGAGISMIKNLAMEYNKQEEKEFMADHAYTILAFFNIIPSIGSKGRKIYSAIQTKRFEKDVIEKRDWDITIDGKFNLSPSYKVLGSLTEGFTNLPLDRAVTELNALTEALDYRNTVWQRVALALGWRSWDVGAENEEHELIKTEAKAKRKEEGKRKAKATRAKTKKEKQRKAKLKEDKKLNTFLD